MKLIIDDREQKIIPFFQQDLDFEVEIKRIHIGDYAITEENDNVLFIFERKTWEDLASSIKDGRKNNVEKLLALRTETNCKIFYLIEGKSRYPLDKKFCRIPFKNLQSHLDHLIVRDNIHVIYSLNNEDTSNRLKEFIMNYLTIKETNSNSIQGGSEMLTKTIPKSDLSILYDIWRCIPNITDKTTTLFLENEISLADLILSRVKEQEVSVLKYPNGSIIGKRAKKICKIQELDNTDNYKYYINILSSLNGITKKTAALILVKYSFRSILEGNVPLNDLKSIKKTEKVSLGEKAAKSILKYISTEKKE